MNRDYQLQFCKACKNQKLDLKKGLVCKLTEEKAEFQDICPSYDEDAELKQKLEATAGADEAIRNSASMGRRIANLFIDLVFLSVLTFIVSLLLSLYIMSNPSNNLAAYSGLVVYQYIFSFLLCLAYYILFEAATGRSIAKFFTGTKVVDENGNHPSFGAIIIRTILRYIPFEALTFLNSDAYGWHDKFSKTRVVRVKK